MFKKFWQHPAVKFIALTLLYFLIIMALVYLYSYSGINNSKFIYNEF
ncbi:teichoic acid D-Ala incorporation-associated protein DltX [Bombilactobacillus folatiphilus]|uniref:Teichoic acid D-Ala incorporation-associated protein DltX n=1 Tax=Bombilactobacillus folatiphilus TaxID=2923362 RepID=A0ABY4PA28_9LACO|nr:teichoic acid D-Ala incorporation-associated protein DltX [Bombilactobacillus folatiphilus]UQS82462.1 teichoic acid D-Ala incorporation-associated protein DltX [Bombilactobacillus folatiphilus]